MKPDLLIIYDNCGYETLTYYIPSETENLDCYIDILSKCNFNYMNLSYKGCESEEEIEKAQLILIELLSDSDISDYSELSDEEYVESHIKENNLKKLNTFLIPYEKKGDYCKPIKVSKSEKDTLIFNIGWAD